MNYQLLVLKGTQNIFIATQPLPFSGLALGGALKVGSVQIMTSGASFFTCSASFTSETIPDLTDLDVELYEGFGEVGFTWNGTAWACMFDPLVTIASPAPADPTLIWGRKVFTGKVRSYYIKDKSLELDIQEPRSGDAEIQAPVVLGFPMPFEVELSDGSARVSRVGLTSVDEIYIPDESGVKIYPVTELNEVDGRVFFGDGATLAQDVIAFGNDETIVARASSARQVSSIHSITGERFDVGSNAPSMRVAPVVDGVMRWDLDIYSYAEGTRSESEKGSELGQTLKIIETEIVDSLSIDVRAEITPNKLTISTASGAPDQEDEPFEVSGVGGELATAWGRYDSVSNIFTPIPYKYVSLAAYGNLKSLANAAAWNPSFYPIIGRNAADSIESRPNAARNTGLLLAPQMPRFGDTLRDVEDFDYSRVVVSGYGFDNSGGCYDPRNGDFYLITGRTASSGSQRLVRLRDGVWTVLRITSFQFAPSAVGLSMQMRYYKDGLIHISGSNAPGNLCFYDIDANIFRTDVWIRGDDVLAQSLRGSYIDTQEDVVYYVTSSAMWKQTGENEAAIKLFETSDIGYSSSNFNIVTNIQLDEHTKDLYFRLSYVTLRYKQSDSSLSTIWTIYDSSILLAHRMVFSQRYRRLFIVRATGTWFRIYNPDDSSMTDLDYANISPADNINISDETGELILTTNSATTSQDIRFVKFAESAISPQYEDPQPIIDRYGEREYFAVSNSTYEFSYPVLKASITDPVETVESNVTKVYLGTESPGKTQYKRTGSFVVEDMPAAFLTLSDPLFAYVDDGFSGGRVGMLAGLYYQRLVKVVTGKLSVKNLKVMLKCSNDAVNQDPVAALTFFANLANYGTIQVKNTVFNEFIRLSVYLKESKSFDEVANKICQEVVLLRSGSLFFTPTPTEAKPILISDLVGSHYSNIRITDTDDEPIGSIFCEFPDGTFVNITSSGWHGNTSLDSVSGSISDLDESVQLLALSKGSRVLRMKFEYIHNIVFIRFFVKWHALNSTKRRKKAQVNVKSEVLKSIELGDTVSLNIPNFPEFLSQGNLIVTNISVSYGISTLSLEEFIYLSNKEVI